MALRCGRFYGPALDGTLPGNEVIVQSRTVDRVMYARALGPMQFLPRHLVPVRQRRRRRRPRPMCRNLFDSSLAAARYLCSGGLNLRDTWPGDGPRFFATNNSVAYCPQRAGLGRRIRGPVVVPVDLPPIIGPIPPIGDMHLDNYEGLGPGLPLNALGLPCHRSAGIDAADGAWRCREPGPHLCCRASCLVRRWDRRQGPFRAAPLTPPPAQPEPLPWLPPWLQQPQQQQPECAVFCIHGSSPRRPAPSALACSAG